MHRTPEDHSVVIESRDLDTDERERVVLPAVRPGPEGAREQELRELIRRVRPEARFRSFSGDVATALDRQHLVVAHYVPTEPTEALHGADQPEDDGEQGELFAA